MDLPAVASTLCGLQVADGILEAILTDFLQPSEKRFVRSRLEMLDLANHAHKGLLNDVVRVNHTLNL